MEEQLDLETAAPASKATMDTTKSDRAAPDLTEERLRSLIQEFARFKSLATGGTLYVHPDDTQDPFIEKMRGHVTVEVNRYQSPRVALYKTPEQDVLCYLDKNEAVIIPRLKGTVWQR